MRVVFTEPARDDLREVISYLEADNPAVADALRVRIDHALDRLSRWPHSAPEVAGRRGVRAVPLVRYPYVIFYEIVGDVIQVLHVRHGARRPWWKPG